MKKRSLILTAIFIIGIIAVSSYGAIESQAYYIPPIGGRMHTVYVSGYVRTDSGAGISGATVKITYGSPETGIYRTATTNSAGYYSTSFTTSLYVYATVRATKSGYIGQTKSVYTSGSRVVNFNLALYARQFSVYGYAKTTSGIGIDDATIRIYYQNSEIDRTTTTASNGYYSFTIVTDLYVYFTMIASKDGYGTDTDTVYSSGSNRVDFALSPPAHTVTCFGVVRDEDSNVIEDATITLSSPTAGGPTATTYTNSLGCYSVTLSTSEYLDYTLEVTKTN